MALLVTCKVSAEALRLLRIIAAMTGEKQYEALERLLRIERERLQAQER